MKTTIDLPGNLLIEAKAVAARRRTTLKEMITRSLQREIGIGALPPLPPDSPYEMSELGLPQLKKRGAAITSEMIYKMLEEMETAGALKARKP
jgi:hypothetical protein